MCYSFYVTLFSNVSKDSYKSNTLAAFTTQLAQAIELHPSDKWELGLCEFTCPPPAVGTLKNHLVVGETCGLIYCNLVSPQFAGDKSVRCLRTFTYPSLYCHYAFENIYYVPVEKRSFREIA
jgi:NAD-dependent dihydropyrimidine dehydrogenase PreA subunit